MKGYIFLESLYKIEKDMVYLKGYLLLVLVSI